MNGTTGRPDAPAEDYAAMRTGVGAHRLSRDWVSVTGPDAESYLQGQCSQELTGLSDGASREALLLSPQGKVDAFVRVTRWADGFVLDTDPGTGPAVVARLRRFKLRVDVAVEPLDWLGVALRGPASGSAQSGGASVVAPVSWPGFTGVDLLGPSEGTDPASWVVGDVRWCGDAAWEALRIEAGIPLWGREIDESTIAAEVGLVERTVSFTKGCFTGQELVARLDARGTKVARRLCGLVITGTAPDRLPPLGAAVAAQGAEESGRITSVGWSSGLDAAVALTVLHRRITPPAEVEVRFEGADTDRLVAEALPLPLAPSSSEA